MWYWKCLLNASMSSESPLIEILVLTLPSLDLWVPSSDHLLKIALSSRSLMIFQVRPSDYLIRFLYRD